jgi:hypothetical protein
MKRGRVWKKERYGRRKGAERLPSERFKCGDCAYIPTGRAVISAGIQGRRTVWIQHRTFPDSLHHRPGGRGERERGEEKGRRRRDGEGKGVRGGGEHGN